MNLRLIIIIYFNFSFDMKLIVLNKNHCKEMFETKSGEWWCTLGGVYIYKIFFIKINPKNYNFNIKKNYKNTFKYI